MFNNISWQGYWITLALIAAGYYAVIYLLYFRKDFSAEWRKVSKRSIKNPFFSPAYNGSSPQNDVNQQPSLFENSEQFQPTETDAIEHSVHACMDEINAYLEEAKRNKCAKDELLFALQTILSSYPAVSASNYKESITNVIVNQCEYLCSVHLSADDVLRVWVNR